MGTAEELFAEGNRLLHARQFEAAIDLYRRALPLAPASPDLNSNLSIALAQLGRHEDALTHARAAADAQPDSAGLLVNYAFVLMMNKRPDQAIDAYARAAAIEPDLAQAHMGLWRLLRDRGRFTEAIRHAQETVRLNPADWRTPPQLALMLLSAGRVEDAAELARAAAAETRDPFTALALAFILNYLPGATSAETLDAHRAMGRLYESAPVAAGLSDSSRDASRAVADADRRLRLGVLSPDFNSSSVSFFAESMYDHLDRERFELYSYFSGTLADRATPRFQAASAAMRSVADLADAELAELIRSDGIDILIDLAGLVKGHRLGVLALKPAPVVVSYIGYPNTTGLPAVDYRIVDSITDPPGAHAGAPTSVERLIRLDPCFLCYRPYDLAPAVAPPPALKNGYITFGSFNQIMKMNRAVVRAWAGVLRRAPGSRLLLKAGELKDPLLGPSIVARFSEAGIEPGRVHVLARTPGLEEHIAMYRLMDIALDPFPYNGTTTTCEALWMGVPVVTLAGEHHAGRVGASLLANAGLPELIAAAESAYIELAARLAHDLPKLAHLRATLRPRMAAAALCDGPAFGRRLGEALRQAWRDRRDLGV